MLALGKTFCSDRLRRLGADCMLLQRTAWFFAVFLVLFTVAPPGAHGQEPFSRIDLAVGGAQNIQEGNLNEARIHDYWKPGYGAELSMSTPFYLGDVEAGVAVHRYKPLSTAVPRFDAFLVHVGWGLNWELVPGFFWYSGIRMGNSRMTFDEDTFPGVKNESEFLLAAHSRATVHITRSTGVYASAHLTQTYTFVRFRTLYISAGLATSFQTPRWLRNFLR